MSILSMDPELGQEVAVNQIDQALRKLWAQDEARTNACLINFAIYSESSGSLQKNSQIVREITQEHACRAILIEMDRGAKEASIHAWITAHCHLSEGKKSVCCEQISFALTGVSRGRLRNTVFAHLSSDLPLILWWQGELSPIFEERLYSVVDRFVFDSSAWKASSNSFVMIRQAIENSTRSFVVQDLAWTRSYHYRLAVAALFDDPLAGQSLKSINRVEITYHQEHRTAALLLLSWLAVQAGWRRGIELNLALVQTNGNKQGYSFEHKNGAVIDVALVATTEGASIGILTIYADGMKLMVERCNLSSHLHLRLEINGHVTDSLTPAGCDDCAQLISDQLARGGKNSLYLKILPMFYELLE